MFKKLILYSFNSRLIVRNARTKNRIVSFKQKAKAEMDEEYCYDDLELDVNATDNLVDDYKKEFDQHRKKLGYLITKQKYFKENFPNFLTWNEKEQIRFLHENQPEDWTIDKLAESFPATPEIIKKITKSKWRPTSKSKIQNHDKNVAENWSELEKGNLTVDSALKQHLNKFINRKRFEIPESKEIKIQKTITKKLKRDEFLNVVKEFSGNVKLKSNREKSTENEDLKQNLQITDNKNISEDKRNLEIAETRNGIGIEQNGDIQETFGKLKIKTKFKKNKLLSLDEFKTASNLSTQENELEKHSEETDQIEEVKEEVEKIKTIDDYSTGIISNVSQPYEKANLEAYAEKIQIPKKFWKKGQIYRVDDCYYDDGGEFLYRVLGMTGNVDEGDKIK